MFPYADWHGEMSGATTSTGRRIPCAADLGGSVPDMCSTGVWPGSNLGAFYEPSDPVDKQAWMGSLTDGKSDASGFRYMRNRYYNPQTGSFTQPDPIGIAGGLNVYGFGEGNPTRYADPFGLDPQDIVVQGEYAKAAVAYLRNHSRTFKTAYDEINRNHNFHLTIVSHDDHNGDEGATNRFDYNEKRGKDQQTTITLSRTDAEEWNYEHPKQSWREDSVTSLAHEMGHAARFYGVACGGCIDPPRGQSGPIIDWENQIRSELPEAMRRALGVRKEY